MAAFKADPSRENASLLAEKIVAGGVTQEDAQEVLLSWLDLKVVVRKSYIPNTKIYITLTSGNETALAVRQQPAATPTTQAARILFSKWNTYLGVPGVTTHKEGDMNSVSVRLDPGFLAKAIGRDGPQWGPSAIVISKPGVHPGMLLFEGKATALMTGLPSDRGIPMHVPGLLEKALVHLGLEDDPACPPPGYRCRIEVPFEIRVEDGPDVP